MNFRRARDAERLNAAIIDAALDAMVIFEADGPVVAFNPAAEAMFGLTAAQALGRSVAELIEVGRIDLNLGGPQEPAPVGQRVELDGLRLGGTRFPAELSIHPVRLDDRTIYVTTVRDLTAEREAAAAMEAQRLRLRQAEAFSAMSSLLAGVAHELNNPLAILVAQSTVLCDKAATPDLKARADRIHAAALRAGRIVKSFLAMAQHKAPALEPLDLNEVLDHALEFVGYGLRSSGIRVVRHPDPALPNVEADRDLIGQVFACLLINAQQALATRDGGRLIEIRSFSAQDQVIVEVEDNGDGVAPEIADRIFDPYFTTRPSGAATGVGLSLCRSILATHGGTIALRDGSAGAKFRVILPCYKPAARRIIDETAERNASMAILVVDDERDVGESLGELIELFGHRVSVETSAAGALDRMSRQAFDMVFSDYHMPEIDGMALRHLIGLRDAALAARTVLMTGDVLSRSGHGHPWGEAQGLVLKKPFTAADVKALLDGVVPSS